MVRMEQLQQSDLFLVHDHVLSPADADAAAPRRTSSMNGMNGMALGRHLRRPRACCCRVPAGQRGESGATGCLKQMRQISNRYIMYIMLSFTHDREKAKQAKYCLVSPLFPAHFPSSSSCFPLCHFLLIAFSS
jgi:hypothetical protein